MKRRTAGCTANNSDSRQPKISVRAEKPCGRTLTRGLARERTAVGKPRAGGLSLVREAVRFRAMFSPSASKAGSKVRVHSAARIQFAKCSLGRLRTQNPGDFRLLVGSQPAAHLSQYA